ncbi:MAG TPA: ABC transporter permease [Bryobacteraceae bacterium]|nr:ABC transporter permease [Bryobacteraceae bacterium]
MSVWSRIANVFRGQRVNREIDEELETHVREAIADGYDPVEARRLLGPALRHREASRDARLVVWMESLRADAVFGFHQLKKARVTSAAAVLSLALAMGACMSAFRLMDALLLRPLPVAEPERLFIALREGPGPDGQPRTAESFSYPLFREMRAAVKGRAELLAISNATRTDITHAPNNEVEKAYRQYVSGWTFDSLGLRPALGRLFTEQDDAKPGGHPYAVLSHEYWTRRFGADPRVLGRTFRLGNAVYEIIGVVGEGFTGTQPGTFVDIFVPTMMNTPSIGSVNAFWIRTFVRPQPGTRPEPLAANMNAVYRAMEQERAKTFTNMPKHIASGYPRDRVVVEPASAGLSAMQRNYSLSLRTLGVLVGLVLLISCANIANLMTARATARNREMALRVSIGAGRARLIQMVLAESAWLAALATIAGGLFAAWSAPLVVRLINPPGDPARLNLSFDWRLLGFGVALAFAATVLFGLAPAFRASGVKPANALKGGDDPHARRRMMHALIAAQVAFCFVVLVVGTLFVSTYDRLIDQPSGYSSERLLALETVAARPQASVHWAQVASHLQSVPGVEAVAYSEWPIMSGEMSNNFISINGAPPSDILTFFLPVSPGWIDAMKIRLLDGRDFRPEEVNPGAVLVNQEFARRYFDGQNPVGKFFDVPQQDVPPQRHRIVGMVGDARYDSMRKPMVPVAYVPYQSVDAKGAPRPNARAAYMVRTTSTDPLALAPVLRREVSKVRSDFRVSNIRTQHEIDAAHTIRERLLAMLAMFFCATALLLAGVGLYGVLDYSVLQRRREIGIRLAIGARASNIVRSVTRDVFAMVLLGAVVGLAGGVASEKYIRSLLFGVKTTDLGMLLLPAAAILAVALLAAVPAIHRAIRINPAKLLRAD